MNGVEILNSTTIYNTFLPEWCIALGLFFGIVSMVLAILLLLDDYHILGFIFIITTIVSVVGGCLGGTANKNSIDYIEYKVTIDDSVSMTEFMDKYEILDQEGKIYIVKERE